MQILQHSQSHQNPLSLTSFNSFSPLCLLPKLSTLTLYRHCPTTTIRMGGGPRTYPGGVSKWQWKRMQAKKAKQLLKARLYRERQIYEMRKRAELKAAVADLERPWEVVERAVPNSALFSVSVDEQLKVLADRFQKPGGFDLWSDEDGPQLFRTPDGLPTARFFPKGVVHSVKPYGIGGVDQNEGDFSVEDEEKEFSRFGVRNSRGRRNGQFVGGSEGSDGEDSDFLGLGPLNGGGTERDRIVHNLTLDGQRRISRGGRRSSRGRRNGKLGKGQFVGGSDREDGENRRRNITRGGLRNSRGRRNGMLGNGQFVGGSEESNEEYSDSCSSRDREGTCNRHTGISRGGVRNSRGTESGRSSSRRMRNGYVGSGDYMKTRNETAFRSEEKNGANAMDSEGRNARYRMNNGRRLSSRGRFSGKSRRVESEDVFEMSLQHDGSYGFSVSSGEAGLRSDPASRRSSVEL